MGGEVLGKGCGASTCSLGAPLRTPAPVHRPAPSGSEPAWWFPWVGMVITWASDSTSRPPPSPGLSARLTSPEMGLCPEATSHPRDRPKILSLL